jgi:hypothetical protein
MNFLNPNRTRSVLTFSLHIFMKNFQIITVSKNFNSYDCVRKSVLYVHCKICQNKSTIFMLGSVKIC